MPNAICPCGKVFEQPERGRARKYCQTCSPVRTNTTSRTCAVDGCDRQHQARGLCRTHYSQWQRERNGGKRYDRKVEVTCELCGSPRMVNAQHAGVQRFCSLKCAAKGSNNHAAILHRAYMRRAVKRQVAIYTGPPYECPVNVIKGKRGRWTAGKCRVCSTGFISDVAHDVTCSTECMKIDRRRVSRMHKEKRRAVKRNAFVANVYRREVFEADGYRCHLCGKLCDKTKAVPHHKAPTIDHVIPLASGGTHEPANCRTAHFICNSRKSHLGGGEQFALNLT